MDGIPTSDRMANDGAVRHFTAEGSRLPFSSCVRVGQLLFLSGQIGVDTAGCLQPDMPSQVAAMMDNIRCALKLAGAELGDIVKCTVMLRDMAQWNIFNDAYLPYFTPGRLPARSAFGGVDLAFGAEVEMECIASLPDGC